MKFVAEGLRPVRLPPSRRSVAFGSKVALASNGLSQEEILQHELPLSPRKRRTADAAGYLAVGCLRAQLRLRLLDKERCSAGK